MHKYLATSPTAMVAHTRRLPIGIILVMLLLLSACAYLPSTKPVSPLTSSYTAISTLSNLPCRGLEEPQRGNCFESVRIATELAPELRFVSFEYRGRDLRPVRISSQGTCTSVRYAEINQLRSDVSVGLRICGTNLTGRVECREQLSYSSMTTVAFCLEPSSQPENYVRVSYSGAVPWPELAIVLSEGVKPPMQFSQAEEQRKK